ncbi:MAG TPA: carboxypeptidase-like regulatory domain-containing protein [Hymenobacter sp.]|uniref:carboxypeptidase-like regulatory domain-containing protein n=1 Tax=Hymenobacter sp. TaxID=1898978 RepID=UPI002ED91CCF
MKHSLLFVSAICVGTLLNGCKGKDGDPGPAGPAGPSLTGGIVGFMDTMDEFGVTQAKNGVTVTLENVTPAVTVTTDASGRYELANVKSGTYTMVYTKPGYGTIKVQGYPHVGGSQPSFLYTRQLMGVSGTTVTSTAVGPIQGTGANRYRLITAALANPSQSINRGLRAHMFLGTSATVTSATGVSYFSGSSNGSTSDFYMEGPALNQQGFASGSTVYAIIYGAPYGYGEDSYTDIMTGRRVYTCLNPNGTRVVSFIVP